MKGLQIGEGEVSKLPPPTDKKYMWEACEIAQRRSEDLIIPITQLLIDRTTHIMKGVSAVAEAVMRSKGSLSLQKKNSFIDFKFLTPLTTHLKDQYSQFVDKTAENTKAKCMEEFYSTQTLYWNVNEQTLKADLLKDPARLLSHIFDGVKSRITRNVTRKIYNIFALPFLKEDIWIELECYISAMETMALEEVCEWRAVEEALDADVQSLQTQLEQLRKNDRHLQLIAPKFLR